MKKRVLACLMVLAVAIAFMPTSAFAGSKVKMTVYDKVIKSENTVYCPAEGNGIYKVALKDGKVTSTKRLVKSDFVMGDYSYNYAMKKKGKYLYYIQGSEGTYWELRRVNVNSGKKKLIAKMATTYAIKGKKLYAKISEETDYDVKDHYKVMTLSGKHKHKTSKKPKMKSKPTNATGYTVKYKAYEDYDAELEDYFTTYVETYLTTPAGTFLLGGSSLER